MHEQQYIVIPNWDGPDGFQHYKDRDPIWIKNYVRLLAKDEYLALTSHRRGVLHGLWLAYASSNRRLRADPRWLSARLLIRVTTKDLGALNHAGFITISASAPLAPSYQDASPHARPSETETEKDSSDRSELRRVDPVQTLTNGTGTGDNHLLDRLIAWASLHVDDDGAQIRRAARGLPDAVLAQVLEAARGRKVENRAGYVVACLKAARETAA